MQRPEALYDLRPVCSKYSAQNNELSSDQEIKKASGKLAENREPTRQQRKVGDLMIIDNNEERNNVIREHCNLVSQMQVMYDAISLSKGIAAAKVAHDDMQAMRQRILKHAEDNQITTAEIYAYRNRDRVQAVSISDAVKKLSKS